MMSKPRNVTKRTHLKYLPWLRKQSTFNDVSLRTHDVYIYKHTDDGMGYRSTIWKEVTKPKKIRTKSMLAMKATKLRMKGMKGMKAAKTVMKTKQ